MKKLLSMLMALMLLMGCVAAAETAVDYTGVWLMSAMEMGGMKLDMNQLAAAMPGVDMAGVKIQLNADGTAVLVMPGEEPENGTWTEAAGVLSITDGTGAAIDAVYQDETLVLGMEGMSMIFAREGAELAAPAENEPAAVLSGVDPAAFEKQWTLTKASVMGLELPAAQLGAAMIFMLSEGTGLFAMMQEDQPIYAEITYKVYEQEGVGTVLELITTNSQTGESSTLLSLNMRADNTLAFSSEVEGMTVTYIFEEVTEEAAE